MEASAEGEDITTEDGTNLEDYQLAKDITRRQVKPPKRFEDY